MFRSVAFSAALVICAAPAVAQEDAANAFADMQAIAETGAIGTDDLPATILTAEGCVLTMTSERANPLLTVPIVTISSADAGDLDPAQTATVQQAVRILLLVRSLTGPVDLIESIDTDDESSRTTFIATGGTCEDGGPCTRVEPAGGLAIPFYGEDAETRAATLAEPLAAFAEACTPSFAGAASEQTTLSDVYGRNLTSDQGTVVINSDGTLTGQFGSNQLTGTWETEDGLFCREGTIGTRALERECQSVTMSGNSISFVSLDGTRSDTYTIN